MAEVRKNTVHPSISRAIPRKEWGWPVWTAGWSSFQDHPGEDWEVQLLKVNKGVAWGKGTRLISPLPVRQEPDCPLQRAVQGVPVPPHVL